jgi:hypothetical protein
MVEAGYLGEGARSLGEMTEIKQEGSSNQNEI